MCRGEGAAGAGRSGSKLHAKVAARERRPIGVVCGEYSEGGDKIGTPVGKPTTTGSSGIVAIIELAFMLVSFSRLRCGLIRLVVRGLGDSKSVLKTSLGIVLGEQGGVSGRSPP